MELNNTVYICALEKKDNHFMWYFFDLKEKRLYKIHSSKRDEISDHMFSDRFRNFILKKRSALLGCLLLRRMSGFFNSLPRDPSSINLYITIDIIVIFLVILFVHYISVKPMPEIKKNSEIVEADYKQIREYYITGDKPRIAIMLIECFLFYLAYYSISRFFMKGRMDWIYELPSLVLISSWSIIPCLPHNILRLHLYLWKEARKEKK